MKHFILSFTLSTLLISSAESTEHLCLPNTTHSLLDENFNHALSQTGKFLLCHNLSTVKDKQGHEDYLKEYIENQEQKVATTANRHEAGEELNQCEATENSKALVLSFAGTGSYNPISHSVLAELMSCENYQSLPESLKKQTYALLYKELKTKKYNKWSGLDQGAMQLFLNDEEINQHTKNFQFATFPSEESELISDPDKLSVAKLKKLPEEVSFSKASQPLGIQNAVDCAQSYFASANAKGISPKLIIMSHSSGGRSVVKFLEQLKLSPQRIEADIVFTIDPVKEAHHAVQEVLEQIPKKGAFSLLNKLPKVSLSSHPLRVWSRHQPDSLYKTSNATKWINFYQQQDSEGIGLPIKFGIYGSPIQGADRNIILKDNLSAKGHGEITYHPKAIETIKEEVLLLYP